MTVITAKDFPAVPASCSPRFPPIASHPLIWAPPKRWTTFPCSGSSWNRHPKTTVPKRQPSRRRS